jgi:hypothetical protein
MLSAGLSAQRVHDNASYAQNMVRQHLHKAKLRLLLIESEFTRLFEERQRLARTA